MKLLVFLSLSNETSCVPENIEELKNHDDDFVDDDRK